MKERPFSEEGIISVLREAGVANAEADGAIYYNEADRAFRFAALDEAVPMGEKQPGARPIENWTILLECDVARNISMLAVVGYIDRKQFAWVKRLGA